jgi:hypothetical protein
MQVTVFTVNALLGSKLLDNAPERRYSSHTFRYGYLVTT